MRGYEATGLEGDEEYGSVVARAGRGATEGWMMDREPHEPTEAARARQGVLLALTIDATPETILRPNDRTHERTKAKARKALREAALLATHCAVVDRPDVVREAQTGRLRFSYAVVWETPLVGRRHVWDDDGLIGGGLKPIRDGICQKLGIDDRNVVTGDVEQRFTEEHQGCVIVVIARMEES